MLSLYPTSVSPSCYSMRQNLAVTASYAAVGAACAKVFHITTPVGGALFHSSAVIARFTWEHLTRDSGMGAYFNAIFKVVIPLLSALGVCLAAGFTLNITTALQLQLISFLPFAYLTSLTNLSSDGQLKLNWD